MESNFPPETTHESEIGSLLNVLRSVVGDHSAVYVSAPITSGKRFADWSSHRKSEVDQPDPGDDQAFKREVLEPNSKHARKIIRKLRQSFPRALIDPTTLKDIEGWTQGDYRFFWAKVIEQYAATAVFLDGWQYSNGCAFEFLVTNRTRPRISALKESLEPLPLDEGFDLIQTAIIELRTLVQPTDFLERVADELGKLCAVEEFAPIA